MDVSSPRVAYLHLGIEKTGTTTLQSFMARNREPLARRGIGYPRTPGWANHHKLNAYAMHPDKLDDTRQRFKIRSAADVVSFRASFRDELYAEVRNDLAGCHKIVLSNEHCSARLTTSDEARELLALLEPLFDRITVVIYLRDQASNMVSSYSTNLRNGATRLPDFDRINWNKYDYYERVTRWSDLVGRDNVNVRIFDRSRLLAGDLIVDFLDAIDEPSGHDLERPAIKNTSLDAHGLRILRLFNEVSGDRRDLDDMRNLRQRLIAVLTQRPFGPMLSFPPDKIRWLRESCRESNRRLAREFLGRAELFPTPTGDDPCAEGHREPTVHELMDTLITLLAVDRSS